MASGNETMPPMSAAAMPRRSVSGPMRTRSADAWSVAVRRTRSSCARKPAIAQTPVDTILGLMPVIRARSEFVAAARTASPNAVCPSSHHMPTVITGTTISTSSWLAVTSMSRPGCHVPVNGNGNWVCSDPVRYSGSASVIASHSCATPIVATSTMTRGDLKRRRITARSMSTPMSVPTTSATRQRGPVRPAVGADHHREQRGRGDAHAADREVDRRGWIGTRARCPWRRAR